MTKSVLAALALCAVVATPAVAVTLSGDTTGGLTYNRPLAGNPPAGLSAVGTDVSYQVKVIKVSGDGGYTFLMTATAPVNWDTYLGLYAGGFDPTDPLANAIVYNDDNPTIGLSGFTATLSAGISYFAVATGFDNNDFGAYTLAINGPGTVLIDGAGGVPEPASWALLIAGFGLTGAALRARKRATATYA